MVIGIYCSDEIISSIVNDGIGEFYTFLLEDPTRTKSIKSTKSHFFPLRCFYAHLKLSLFLLAYVRFVLFVRVGSFRKTYKTP